MRYKFFLPVLSAVLLILAYPNFDLEFLAWVAFIPLFFAIENKGKRQRFLAGYFFGIVFFSGILYWLVNVTVPGTIALILLLSIAPAIFTSLYPIPYTLYAIVFVPALWVTTEYLRAYLFTGFPWALLGYSQSFNLPMIQIADMTGVYGVSFLVMIVNFGIYLALRKRPGRFYILFFIFILFALTFGYGQKRITQRYPIENLKVAVIQGNIPQTIKWDPRYRKSIIGKYKAITKESLSEEGLSLVIWPETALPGYLEESDLKKEVTEIAKSDNIYLLTGTLRKSGLKTYNSATLVSNKGKVLTSYDKIHLVPFGEFIPFEKSLFRIRSFIDKPIGDFDRGGEFTVFKFRFTEIFRKPDRIRKATHFHSFSVLICFEDVFPELSRNFVRNGARFLVNITNDAWFGKTAAPMQHVQCSVFRAVENRVPVLRAANTGVSCIIDHRGKIVKSVKEGDRQIFVAGYASGNIAPTFAKSFYTRFGDVFAWGCIVVTLLGLVVRKRLVPMILVMILAFPFAAYGEGETYYRGKFKFAFPFGRKYDYTNILVTKVIDGDTIELENKERVRLIGIDTPEARYSRKLERDAKRTKTDHEAIIAMGRKTASFTRSLVEGKRVRLEFDVEKKDRYDRLLAYVYLPDGRLLNAELLKEGYAQVYTFPPNVKHLELFRKLQKEARGNKRGFWGE
ncbi:MAG: apolipoprotein N-acyltransferase [Candidatus Omnitrophota bacterium]